MNQFKSYEKADVTKKPRKSSILRKKRIAQFINPTDRVLDIGACNNLQLPFLTLHNENQYSPVDINKFTEETIVADITKEKLPFEENSFDKIIFSMVLEHLDTPMPALKEIQRVLKPEGSVIIVVPNAENIVKNMASIIFEKKYIKNASGEHCIGFGTEEICNLLKRANFSIEHFEKRSPEIVNLKLMLPEWKIFKPAASDILVVAKIKH